MAVDRERWSICSRSAMAMLKDGGKARTPTHINAASTGTEPLAIGTYRSVATSRDPSDNRAQERSGMRSGSGEVLEATAVRCAA